MSNKIGKMSDLKRAMDRAYAPAVIDIETAGDGQAVARSLLRPPKFAAPKNYKDEDKKREYVAKRLDEWRAETAEKAALSPLTGRVVAVSQLVCAGYDDSPEESVAVDGKDERLLLTEVAESLQYKTPVVTFNGYDFDVWFLRVRMIANGVTVPRCLLPGPRYDTSTHFDVRMVLTNGNSRVKGKLEDWHRLITGEDIPTIEHPLHGTPINGADVGGLMASGHEQIVGEYCLNDARATWRIYKAIRHAC